MRKKFRNEVERARIRTGFYKTDSREQSGAFMFSVMAPDEVTFTVIVDDGNLSGWEHVSVSTPTRTPTWGEMCWVKDLFFEDNETAVQYHPAKSDYVNHHPYCLHIWRPKKGIDTPPAILVGPVQKRQ